MSKFKQGRFLRQVIHCGWMMQVTNLEPIVLSTVGGLNFDMCNDFWIYFRSRNPLSAMQRKNRTR